MADNSPGSPGTTSAGQKRKYVVDPMLLSQARKEMIVMHPLPRVNEIPEQVDTDDRAYYCRQVQNGLYIRMALLAAVLDCLP